MPIGEVTVTTVVHASTEEAFRLFTEHIDRWWVRTPGKGREMVVRFDVDRLVAATIDGAETLATVSVWDPPARFEMDWRGPHSQPGDVVIVEFLPEAAGTRIVLRHRREGVAPADTTAAVLGLWWGDIVSRFAAMPPVGPKPG